MIFWSLFEGMACKASCLELSLNLCFDVFIYYLKLSIKSKQKAASILKTISFTKEVQADRGIPIELSKKKQIKSYVKQQLHCLPSLSSNVYLSPIIYTKSK